MNSKHILDVCCGSRMFWFEKNHENAVYCDIRQEKPILCDGRELIIKPDVVCDFRELPFKNGSFQLVVFDPPHLEHAGKTSWMYKKYGVLGKSWRTDLQLGFAECWRVMRPLGTLVFKWSDTQIPLGKITHLFPSAPAFGHTTTHNLKTHWVTFFKG